MRLARVAALALLAWQTAPPPGTDLARMAAAERAFAAATKASEGRPGTPERGFFVRVWHRDMAEAWKIAFETNGIR